MTNYRRTMAESLNQVYLDEAKYDLYHKDFSSAMQHAYKMAKKLHGITIDPKEIDDKVATGPSKPSSGKTNKYRLKGDKGNIQIQIANLDNKKYELNMYKEEVELDEGNIDKIKDIVSKKSASKIDGVTVDMFTASAISQIYDKVNDANKKKMEKLPITKLAALAMKMMKNEYVPEEVDLDEKKKEVVFKGTPAQIKKQMKNLKKKDKLKIGEEDDLDEAKFTIKYDKNGKNYTDTIMAKDKDDAVQKALNTFLKGIKGNKFSVRPFKEEAVSMAQQAAIAISKKERGNKPKKEEVELEEGTSAVPTSMADFRGIMNIMKRPIKAKDAEKAISKYINDDYLANAIMSIEEKDPNADARPAIMKGFNKLEISTKGEPSYGTIIKFNRKFEIADKRQKMYLDSPPSEDANDMGTITLRGGSKVRAEEVDLDEASARADAMRAMRKGRGVDPADVDTDASDDDVKAASKNIIMQLRKSVSLRGNFPVEFMDKKKVKVSAKIAAAAQNKYNSMKRAEDKEKFQAKISKSYKDMLSALKEESVKEQLLKIKGKTPADQGRRAAVEDDIERAKKKNDKKLVAKLQENTILDKVSKKLKEIKNG